MKKMFLLAAITSSTFLSMSAFAGGKAFMTVYKNEEPLAPEECLAKAEQEAAQYKAQLGQDETRPDLPGVVKKQILFNGVSVGELVYNSHPWTTQSENYCSIIIQVPVSSVQ